MTTSGLRIAPQARARRRRSSSTSRARRQANTVDEADGGPDRAVHLDHVLRAGALVEGVDVLRHNRARSRALELGERGAPRLARPRPAREAAAVELPHLRGSRRNASIVAYSIGSYPTRSRPSSGSRGSRSRSRPRLRQRDAGCRPSGSCGETVDAHRSILGAWTATPTLLEGIRVRFAETDAQGSRTTRLPRLVRGRARRLPRAARGRLPGHPRVRDRALVTESHVRYGAPARFDDVLASICGAWTSEARGSAST